MMLAAAVKALTQMFSPPLRAVLFKAAGLALLLVIVMGVVLLRLLAWLVEIAGVWVEGSLGTTAHFPLGLLAWTLSLAIGFGILAGMLFLMPAATALLAGFFADDIARQVEITHYPFDPPGAPLPVARGLLEGVKTALLAILVYLCAVPFLLLAGVGAVIFFLAAAYLLGREYFELAAMRFLRPAEAKALRKRNAATIFVAGLFIAAFVSIPIVNLATPLFATAFMVHMHKRLSERRPTLIVAEREP
jgi:uncharacterized protein involved in cysteine biosynthesis